MGKKFYCFLLVLTMIISILPLVAFGETANTVYEESFEGLWTISEGKTMALYENVAQDITPADGKKALRLGGNTLIEKSFTEGLAGCEMSFMLYDDMAADGVGTIILHGGKKELIFGLYSSARSGSYFYRFGGAGNSFIDTGVVREKGWHKFNIKCGDDIAELSVDEKTVGILEGTGTWTTVKLGATWPGNSSCYTYIDNLIVKNGAETLFSDSFEEPDMASGWKIADSKSNVEPSSPISEIGTHDGKTALKVTGNAVIEREFIQNESLDHSKISVWLYDDLSGDGIGTIMLEGDSKFLVFGLANPYLRDNYTYRFGPAGSTFVNTGIARTKGWHQLVVDCTTPGTAILTVDGKVAGTLDKVGVWKRIKLGATWHGNYNNKIYMDDLKIQKSKDAPYNPDVESWHFLDTASPWTKIDNNTGTLSVENSILSVPVVTTADTVGISAAMSLDAKQSSIVQLNVNPGSSSKIKLSFTTNSSPTQTDDKTIVFDVVPNMQKTYTLDMSGLSTWSDSVLKLNFNFPGALSGETVKIDLIKTIDGQFVAEAEEFTPYTPLETATEKDFRVAHVFSDNMVLQRNKNIKIWGIAQPGETVTVSFDKQTKTAVAQEDNFWQIILDPMEVNTGTTMTVSGDKDTAHRITLENVCVGEVWLISGQSNTVVTTNQSSHTAANDINKANYPYIRYGLAPKISSEKPIPNTYISDNITWIPVTDKASATNMPGLGFYYAVNLYTELTEKEGTPVPVGIINAGVAGTCTEPWLPEEELAGVYPPEEKRESAASDSTYYNGMIHPLSPFTLRGILWYQGESSANTMSQATYHYQGLKALFSGWRRTFENPDMSFLTVQLPGFSGSYAEDTWAYIREGQLLAARSTPGVGMVVSADYYGITNLHPANKNIVGKRLCVEAMRTVYGGTDAIASPVYKSMEVQDNNIILTFDNVGTGLKCKEGETLTEFEICGEDGVLYPAEAEIISANTVKVTSSEVSEPKQVYYAFRNAPIVNLYNSADLPASPFRTDMPFVEPADPPAVNPPVDEPGEEEYLSENFEDKSGDIDGTKPQSGQHTWVRTGGQENKTGYVTEFTDRNGASTKALVFNSLKDAISLEYDGLPTEKDYILTMWLYDEFTENGISNFTLNFDNTFVGFDLNATYSPNWRYRKATGGNADLLSVNGEAIARSKGWHKVEIKVKNGVGTLYIDGVQTGYSDSISKLTFNQRPGWFTGSVTNTIYIDDIEVTENVKILMGDVDGNGKIAIYDAVAILKHVARIQNLENTEAADVDGDGKIIIQDAILLIKYVAGLIGSLTK